MATPTRVLTVVRMVDVDAGQYHACAVGSDSSAWCWGDNTYGELGDGKGGSFDEANRQISRPVRVVGRGWSSISTVGGSSCGLKKDATAWCWGDHAAWVSGVPKAASPVKTDGLWRQVATGYSYVCGVHTDGTGWCWGDDRGQLGSASAVPQGTKFQVPGEWALIVPGADPEYGKDVTCGVRTDHTAWCWGDNTYGALGNGTNDPSRVPVPVGGVHEWASVTVGGHHACGIDMDHVAWCWGENYAGALGDGTFSNRTAPVRVTVAGTWRSLDAGYQHMCGVTTAGAGWCWGWNDDGQLGDGTATTVFFPEPEPHHLGGTWSDLAAGLAFSVGSSGGTARAWGRSGYGQTGFGRAKDQLTPRKVPINP